MFSDFNYRFQLFMIILVLRNIIAKNLSWRIVWISLKKKNKMCNMKEKSCLHYDLSTLGTLFYKYTV